MFLNLIPDGMKTYPIKKNNFALLVLGMQFMK